MSANRTEKIATRHKCLYSGTDRCFGGAGKPKTKRCPACGGVWLTLKGVYGVWRHSSITGSATYPLSEALATYSTERAANNYADTHPRYTLNELRVGFHVYKSEVVQ